MLQMLKIIFIIFLLSGCTVYGGLSAHTEHYDKPEIQGMENPIGIIRGEIPLNNTTKIFCEHLSSIPTYEQGYGFNHCGGLIRLK